MSKVLLETVQVVRAVSSIGLKPVEKVAAASVQAGEDLAVWGLKLHPVQEVLGRDRTAAALDQYFQAKELALGSLQGMRRQSWISGMQTMAEYGTTAMRQMGTDGRVVGPSDPHWNTQKVIRDLRAAEVARATKANSSGRMQLTPRRFVFFMREAERKRATSRRRDPVEQYVEWMLHNGHLSSMGPRFLEKKLYMDVARIICYAFDRGLKDVNGTNVWGHALQVRVSMEAAEDARHRSNIRSAIGTEQVESLVDRMLMSGDLEVPPQFDGMQKQLLMNCTFMLLQLIEDLTSSDHLSVTVLGHALRVSLETLPLNEVLNEDGIGMDEDGSHSFNISSAAVDELVDALIEEPEVQLVLVPDIFEAEVYRYALHRMICIAEFVLSHLRINLFGNEIRMQLVASEASDHSKRSAEPDDKAITEVHVQQEDLDDLLQKLEDERQRIDHELRRRFSVEADAYGSQDPLEEKVDFAPDADGVHPFQTMAAQDQLARCLVVHKTVEVSIENAFSMVADINQYPRWMPFCTDARVVSAEDDRRSTCEVGFGLETGTMLGAVGDTITYHVTSSTPASAEGGDGLRTARVIADTPEGFRYGKRLVYDWRFTEVAKGETDVKLDMFFQAGSVWFLPLWDSMQATIMGAMMQKFTERADFLREEESKKAASASGAADSHAQAPE